MRAMVIVIAVFSVLFTTRAFPYVDSLWIAGGVGSPGDLASVEVWLQYEGGGVTDSLEAFDIPLTWDAQICSVEAITVGPDFATWTFQGTIDNNGTEGPPALPKVGLSAYTYGPPIGPPFVERGTHLVATVDFRIFDMASPGDSVYIDTLMQAFSPPLYLGFMDKMGLLTYAPAYAGDFISVFYCGDCNGDGWVTFLDLSYLNDYISHGGPAPFGSGDVNQDEVVDADDLSYLSSYLFDGGPPPCGIDPLPCALISSLTDSVEIGDTVICCDMTTLSLPITLKNTSTLMGMTFALKYDTALVVCDSVRFNSGLFHDWSQETRIDTDSGTILMAVWTPSLIAPHHLPPDSYEAATLWFSSLVPPEAQEGISQIDATFILPDHTVSLVDHNQTVLSPTSTPGTLHISSHCGDVNADCTITFADALYLRNYYYQTPPGSPPPICEGDVNLDGTITFADALHIKNYYYQTPPGSPPPCEPGLTAPTFD